MLKRHPKPDIEAALPPKLDSFAADFAGKKLDKARDSQLAKIQGAMLYAASPLTSGLSLSTRDLQMTLKLPFMFQIY